MYFSNSFLALTVFIVQYFPGPIDVTDLGHIPGLVILMRRCQVVIILVMEGQLVQVDLDLGLELQVQDA